MRDAEVCGSAEEGRVVSRENRRELDE